MEKKEFSPYADLKAAGAYIKEKYGAQDARSFVLGALRYVMDRNDWYEVEMKRTGYLPLHSDRVSPKKSHKYETHGRWLREVKQMDFNDLFETIITSEAWQLPHATPEENRELYEARIQMASALYHAFKQNFLEI